MNGFAGRSDAGCWIWQEPSGQEKRGGGVWGEQTTENWKPNFFLEGCIDVDEEDDCEVDVSDDFACVCVSVLLSLITLRNKVARRIFLVYSISFLLSPFFSIPTSATIGRVPNAPCVRPACER